MKYESGRSLIEILGVLAIGAIMTVATVNVYNNIRLRQVRTIAIAELKQIAQNTKLLISPVGDYSVISVDYLIQSGALKNANAPIGGNDWSISSVNENAFSINLTNLSKSDCAYFTNANIDFVYKISVNGYDDEVSKHCFSNDVNQISLFIE